MNAQEAIPGGLDSAEPPVLLSVAFPYAPIGPHAVGGAEVICSEIVAALPELGDRSVVVAHEASTVNGVLYGTHVPAGTITEEVRSAVEASQQENIDRAFREHSVALVHMHGLDFQRYRIPEHVPVIVTMHLPPSWYPETLWNLPPDYHLVCVSETQRRACPEGTRERLRVISNGVRLPEKSTLRSEGRYALMLARICPEKNLHVGLDAARLAGMSALLGGEVFAYEEHQRYFSQEIEPRLTSMGSAHHARVARDTGVPVARFLGPVGAEDKVRTLSRAACLLLPSLAPETSSLVAMEALAAGVPVIGMAVGAVPEIVDDGRTGFLIQPGQDAATRLAAAIRRLPELDRPTCRKVAEDRFPLQRMLDEYRRLYREVARVPRIQQAPSEENGDLSGEPSEGQPLPRFSLQDARIEEFIRGQEFAALEPAWTALWAADDGATPFQHPAWLIPWWRQFGPDGELQALRVTQAGTGRLLALLPLYAYQREGGGRQLLLMGAGTSDYLDGIWRPGSEEVARGLVEEFLQPPRRWNELSLFQLRPDSPLACAMSRAGLPLTTSEPTSLVSVARELPAKLRANIGRHRRRAELRGVLALRVAKTESEALGCFEQLADFHRQRWVKRDEPGVLSDKRVVAHHRESIPLLLKAGLLYMFSLSQDHTLMGVLYGFGDPPGRSGRRLYLYLIGFDQACEDLSPGTLLLHKVWEYARAEGFAMLDLLRGGERYKRYWGAQQEETFALELQNDWVRSATSSQV